MEGKRREGKGMEGNRRGGKGTEGKGRAQKEREREGKGREGGGGRGSGEVVYTFPLIGAKSEDSKNSSRKRKNKKVEKKGRGVAWLDMFWYAVFIWRGSNVQGDCSINKKLRPSTFTT